MAKCENCKIKGELKNLAVCEDCGQLTSLGLQQQGQMKNLQPCLHKGKASYVVCKCKNCA